MACGWSPLGRRSVTSLNGFIELIYNKIAMREKEER
jgi:hypothetical protein